NITSNKSSSSSTNRQHSTAQMTYEPGSVVWCKFANYPYWPAIVSKKITKSTGSIVYDVLFFGTFSSVLAITPKWLEPYKGAVEFQKRIKELKASEIPIKNKPSQYDMTIKKQYSEEFQKAIKQASEIVKISNLPDRLEPAQNMCKGTTYDFLTVQLDDDNEKENEEDNHGINSNIAKNNNSIQLSSSILS
ncbi:unnamed protein product, partial [Rotaria sp. Silwood2]